MRDHLQSFEVMPMPFSTKGRPFVVDQQDLIDFLLDDLLIFREDGALDTRQRCTGLRGGLRVEAPSYSSRETEGAPPSRSESMAGPREFARHASSWWP